MSELTDQIKTDQAALEVEKQVILEERDADIKAAKDKYTEALKAITKKQGRLKRMAKSAASLDDPSQEEGE